MGRVVSLWVIVVLVASACHSQTGIVHFSVQPYADADALERQRKDDTSAPPLWCKTADTPVAAASTEGTEQHPQSQQDAPQVTFEFRGCHFGDVFSEAVAAEHGYMCSRLTQFERVCVNTREQLAGREVTIFYLLRNGKLAGLDIFFPPADYPAILASFVEQFGAPHRQTKEVVEPRIGAPLLNDTASWQTEAGELIVRRYSSTMEDGTVTIRLRASGKHGIRE